MKPLFTDEDADIWPQQKPFISLENANATVAPLQERLEAHEKAEAHNLKVIKSHKEELDRLNGETSRLSQENERLKKKEMLLQGAGQLLEARLRSAEDVVKKYRHCRHACLECFCTKEARAYLERQPR